ncbi:MAG: HAD family phosphatase [Candidatus Staskawiczbacteria bacterium]|nr:HAD family phosphatase [Candidatus Staskawiczbacteria bacterium]
MIKAVIFDYGGVMKDAHALSLDVAIICEISQEEFEKTREKRKEIVGMTERGEINDEEYWERYSKIIDKSIRKDAVGIAQKLYRETFIFHKEMFDLAKSLREKGIKTAVLSNIFKFEADVIREKKGYDEFNPVILSYEVRMNKPNKDIYLFALEKLNLKSEECIFIDDKERYLVPAKELGIKTILFENPEQTEKDVFLIINSQNPQNLV